MIARVKVTYNAKSMSIVQTLKIDEKIMTKMRNIGALMYGSGYNVETDDRDMVFDLPVGNQDGKA